jgi:hypothetical protein
MSSTLDNNLLAVGSPYEGQGQYFGIVNIYIVNTGALLRVITDPYPCTNCQFGRMNLGLGFGQSVGLYDNVLVAGLARNNHAYVFSATTGSLIWNLTIPWAAWFGYSVAIDKNLILVGAPHTNDNPGDQAGEAFTFNVTTGALVSNLTNPDPISGDDYGGQIAIENGVALVGSDGSVYSFNATTGSLISTLTVPGRQRTGFGPIIVGLVGGIGFAGVYYENDSTTTVQVPGQAFTFNYTTGQVIRTFRSPEPTFEGSFGGNYAISNGILFISAPNENQNGYLGAGHVYEFNETTGALLNTFSSPNLQSHEDFGGPSLAAGDGYLVIDSAETIGGQSAPSQVYVYCQNSTSCSPSPSSSTSSTTSSSSGKTSSTSMTNENSSSTSDNSASPIPLSVTLSATLSHRRRFCRCDYFGQKKSRALKSRVLIENII